MIYVFDGHFRPQDHPYDALDRAMGSMLHRLDYDPDGAPIIATIDATELLLAFGRWCALTVADVWGAPPPTQLYLVTGDETLRAAAWAAADAKATHADWPMNSRACPAWAAADAATGYYVRHNPLTVARAAAAKAQFAFGDAKAAARKQRERFAEMVEEAFAGP